MRKKKKRSYGYRKNVELSSYSVVAIGYPSWEVILNKQSGGSGRRWAGRPSRRHGNAPLYLYNLATSHDPLRKGFSQKFVIYSNQNA